MKKVFKKIKADAGKLNVQLVHDFYPLADNKDVYLVVEHIKNGDMMGFASVSEDGSRDIDFSKMFIKKVKEVHGIEIEGADGTVVEATKHDLVNIMDPDFMAIVMGTCAHLLEGMALTEDESKN